MEPVAFIAGIFLGALIADAHTTCLLRRARRRSRNLWIARRLAWRDI